MDYTDNMDTSFPLETIGLNERELLTYQTLLGLSKASIRQVAAASGINRGSTYEHLKHLAEVGLVGSQSSGTRQKFFAEPPAKLYDLVARRRAELELAQEKVVPLVRTLASLAPVETGAPMMRFYEDDEGIAAILQDVLETMQLAQQKEYYTYSSRPLRQYLYRLSPGFTRQRIAGGITVKVIAIGEGGELTSLAERKWLPAGTETEVSAYTIIYGDKVALIALSARGTPYGVIVEESGVAAMQRLLFEQIWRTI
jgi:sugar-specific transcriptional regulator TrmB